MALEFPGVTQVWDCRFEAMFILEESVPPGTLEVAKDGISWSVKSSSALETMQGDLEWTRSVPEFDVMHAYGKVGYGKPELSGSGVTKIDVDAVLARCIQTHAKDEIYANVDGFVQFGPESVFICWYFTSFSPSTSRFMRLNRASINDTEAICWIRGHVDGLNTTDYIFHPALMDAVFQVFSLVCQYWSSLLTSRNHFADSFLLEYGVFFDTISFR
jgi:fatty acid synthase, animal type